jgi:hypothetical protein
MPHKTLLGMISMVDYSSSFDDLLDTVLLGQELGNALLGFESEEVELHDEWLMKIHRRQ